MFLFVYFCFVIMVVISYAVLRDFFNAHANAKDAMNNWYRFVSRADWSSYHDMKAMINSVDAIGNDRYVFNIRGNNYRIIALIFFDTRPFLLDMLAPTPITTN